MELIFMNSSNYYSSYYHFLNIFNSNFNLFKNFLIFNIFIKKHNDHLAFILVLTELTKLFFFTF